MTHLKGFTLIESLTVVCIAGLIFISGFPALAKIIEQQRLHFASSALIRTLQIARYTAVVRNATVCIANKNSSWASGWQIFLDANRNCHLDSNEEILFEEAALPTHIAVVATLHAQDHILYTATGESEHLNGAIQADSVYFCPENKAYKGIRIVVARGGSIHSEEVQPNSSKCTVNS